MVRKVVAMLVCEYPEYVRAACIKWTYGYILSNDNTPKYWIIGFSVVITYLVGGKYLMGCSTISHFLVLGLAALVFFLCINYFLYKPSCFPISSPERYLLCTSKRRVSILTCLFTQLFLCVVFLFLFTAACYSTWHSKLPCWPAAPAGSFSF